MNRLRASLLQASVLAFAAVCALQSASDARAQGASPPPGKALVVLYRADKQPVAARIPIIANADRLGDLGNGEFVNAVVNPGRTFLRAGDRILATLALQTSANHTYYVLIEAVPGMTPVRAELREMTAASAQRALAQSRPAAAGAAAPAAPRAPAAAAVPLAAAPAARPAPAQPAPAAAPPPARQVQAAPPPKPAAPPPAPKPAAPPPAPAQRAAEPPESAGRGWEFALIAKTGAFKLANVNQTLGGLDSTYEKSSKPAVGFEGEMRNEDGLAIGAELFYYKNKVTPNSTALQADQTALAGFLNLKYYFDTGTFFYPFVGGGLGYAGTKFGGDLQGSTGGFAYQGLLGADLRFGTFGLYLEYKYLGATTADKSGQTVKAGGTGFLAGISIAF